MRDDSIMRKVQLFSRNTSGDARAYQILLLQIHSPASQNLVPGARQARGFHVKNFVEVRCLMLSFILPGAPALSLFACSLLTAILIRQLAEALRQERVPHRGTNWLATRLSPHSTWHFSCFQIQCSHMKLGLKHEACQLAKFLLVPHVKIAKRRQARNKVSLACICKFT